MATTVLVHEWVTGGGLAGSELPPSWAAEGRAMRRAIAADFASVPGVRVTMTLDERLPDEPGPWTVARVGAGAEPGEFARLAAAAEWTALIAPESGGILADRTRILERAGGRPLGSTVAAVELTGDKLRLGAYWRERGIPTPDCRRVVPAEGIPADVRRPAVIKPIDGAGSLDTFLIPDAAPVPDDLRALPEALAQAFVPGLSMSACFVAGAGGRATLIAVGRQRVVVRGSRLAYLGGTLPAPVPCDQLSLRRAVEAVPGLRGFVGLDFLWDERDGSMTFLEINPRPTTSYVGLAQLLPPGALARSWIAAVEGAVGHEEGAAELAGLVRSRGRVTFDADGTIHTAGEGAQP